MVPFLGWAQPLLLKINSNTSRELAARSAHCENLSGGGESPAGEKIASLVGLLLFALCLSLSAAVRGPGCWTAVRGPDA
jgi:hypothetical protein